MGRAPDTKAPVANAEDGPLIERVDRYILVVTACQPVVDWVRSLEDLDGVEEGDVRFSLEEAGAIPSTYLVPFSFDPDPVIAWVTDNCDTIFEAELASLEPDPDRWPQDRSAEVFERWFDLRLFDAPIDLVDGPFYLSALSPEETEERIAEIPSFDGGSV